MRIFFSLFIIIHGMMHLPGYARAFHLSSFLGKNPVKISKSNGLLWGIAAILFFLTGIMVLSSWEYWWTFSLASIVLSQYVIFTDWKEAKSGTMVNLVILTITVIVLLNIYKLNSGFSS